MLDKEMLKRISITSQKSITKMLVNISIKMKSKNILKAHVQLCKIIKKRKMGITWELIQSHGKLNIKPAVRYETTI
jgi:hypothetical protein